MEAMRAGKRIEIRGFGSFVVKHYDSYHGRNPRTGESIQVKPKRLPFFKVGKELKERVDEKDSGKKETPPAQATGTDNPGPGTGSPPSTF